MRTPDAFKLVIPLIIALTAQRLVASDNQHSRVKVRAAAIKQFRNGKCLCRAGGYRSTAQLVGL
jgi:hypothetical protein